MLLGRRAALVAANSASASHASPSKRSATASRGTVRGSTGVRSPRSAVAAAHGSGLTFRAARRSSLRHATDLGSVEYPSALLMVGCSCQSAHRRNSVGTFNYIGFRSPQIKHYSTYRVVTITRARGLRTIVTPAYYTKAM